MILGPILPPPPVLKTRSMRNSERRGGRGDCADAVELKPSTAAAPSVANSRRERTVSTDMVNSFARTFSSALTLRQRLMQQGYATLAADPDAARKIKTAAGAQAPGPRTTPP